MQRILQKLGFVRLVLKNKQMIYPYMYEYERTERVYRDYVRSVTKDTLTEEMAKPLPSLILVGTYMLINTLIIRLFSSHGKEIR